MSGADAIAFTRYVDLGSLLLLESFEMVDKRINHLGGIIIGNPVDPMGLALVQGGFGALQVGTSPGRALVHLIANICHACIAKSYKPGLRPARWAGDELKMDLMGGDRPCSRCFTPLPGTPGSTEAAIPSPPASSPSGGGLSTGSLALASESLAPAFDRHGQQACRGGACHVHLWCTTPASLAVERAVNPCCRRRYSSSWPLPSDAPPLPLFLLSHAVGGPFLLLAVLLFGLLVVWKRIDRRAWLGHPLPAYKPGACKAACMWGSVGSGDGGSGARVSERVLCVGVARAPCRAPAALRGREAGLPASLMQADHCAASSKETAACCHHLPPADLHLLIPRTIKIPVVVLGPGSSCGVAYAMLQPAAGDGAAASQQQEQHLRCGAAVGEMHAPAASPVGSLLLGHALLLAAAWPLPLRMPSRLPTDICPCPLPNRLAPECSVVTVVDAAEGGPLWRTPSLTLSDDAAEGLRVASTYMPPPTASFACGSALSPAQAQAQAQAQVQLQPQAPARLAPSSLPLPHDHRCLVPASRAAAHGATSIEALASGKHRKHWHSFDSAALAALKLEERKPSAGTAAGAGANGEGPTAPVVPQRSRSHHARSKSAGAAVQ